jgi:hypothetical protein
VTIYLRKPHYVRSETDAIAFMRTRIEPHMKAINDELRKAGLVGPGRELEVHVTSQAENLRTVIEWREDA